MFLSSKPTAPIRYVRGFVSNRSLHLSKNGTVAGPPRPPSCVATDADHGFYHIGRRSQGRDSGSSRRQFTCCIGYALRPMERALRFQHLGADRDEAYLRCLNHERQLA